MHLKFQYAEFQKMRRGGWWCVLPLFDRLCGEERRIGQSNKGQSTIAHKQEEGGRIQEESRQEERVVSRRHYIRRVVIPLWWCVLSASSGSGVFSQHPVLGVFSASSISLKILEKKPLNVCICIASSTVLFVAIVKQERFCKVRESVREVFTKNENTQETRSKPWFRKITVSSSW
jgi:hypothetical protein